MDAVEYAKHKIAMFPDVYKAYKDNQVLFEMLVEQCRTQLEIGAISMEIVRGGSMCAENTI